MQQHRRASDFDENGITLIENALAGDTIPTTTLEDVLAVIGHLEERLQLFEETISR